MASNIERTVIFYFWLHFLSILDHFGPLWFPNAPISEQICIVCITWARSQGYKPFSEDSGLQWPQILKKLRFSIFDYIFALTKKEEWKKDAGIRVKLSTFNPLYCSNNPQGSKKQGSERIFAQLYRNDHTTQLRLTGLLGCANWPFELHSIFLPNITQWNYHPIPSHFLLKAPSKT